MRSPSIQLVEVASWPEEDERQPGSTIPGARARLDATPPRQAALARRTGFDHRLGSVRHTCRLDRMSNPILAEGGHRESIGLHSLTLSAVATAMIRFDSPVLLDEALDAIWSWRRYFQQIAMRPLPFLTLGCRTGVKRGDRWSELYLPNLEGAAPPSDRERTSFGPWRGSLRRMAASP